MIYGIRLADGTFIDGSIGKSGDRIELVISSEDAAKHLLDLMDPEKTKVIKYVVDRVVAEYEGYVFSFIQQDSTEGKVDVWMKQKGE